MSTARVPDLIYLPETDFSMPDFIEDVKQHLSVRQGNCIVAVSEGIHYEDGGFVSEAKVAANDGFGHAQLGGLATILARGAEGGDRRQGPRH